MGVDNIVGRSTTEGVTRVEKEFRLSSCLDKDL